MTPEFHRPLSLDRIGPAGHDHLVEANPAECAALATRLGVPAVLSLRCRYRLTAGAGGIILAEGHLTARMVRTCVVSLDDFETEIAEDFRLQFVPAGTEDDEPYPESDDEIPYEGAAIDLGEATAEQLALTLDPYPRRPGASLPEGDDPAALSPFAALARRRPPH